MRTMNLLNSNIKIVKAKKDLITRMERFSLKNILTTIKNVIEIINFNNKTLTNLNIIEKNRVAKIMSVQTKIANQTSIKASSVNLIQMINIRLKYDEYKKSSNDLFYFIFL